MFIFLKCAAKVIGYFEICNIFAKKISEMDKIIGLGNALIDILVMLKEEDVLRKMHLPKGAMTLIDNDRYQIIRDYFSGMHTEISTGGSAGNTIHALACLGAGTGFVGKVGNDGYGDFFRETLLKQGTEAHLLASPALPSGVAFTFVLPDGERTFGTYLGAASSLHGEELSLEMFKGYAYLFIEGYLVQDHAMILRAVELAKEAGLQVCLDMASYNIVEAERDFFALLMNKYVDIVFANEEEARAFTGKEPEEAVDLLAKQSSIAVVKIGAKGSLIRKGTEKIRVKALSVPQVVDTTGAGDYFAAGLLYGLSCGCSLEKCARIGSILSGYVIRQMGAGLFEAWWDEVRREVAKVCEE